MIKNKESIVQFLKNNTILKTMDTDDISRLMDSGDIHYFDEKETIITEHEPGSTLFFIIEGNVDIIKKEETKDVYICTLGSGEFFGEAGLFSTVKRTATVNAATETSILKIRRENFISFIKTNPSGGIKILMLIIYSLLKKLRTANQELAFERKFDIEQDDIDSLINSLL